MDNNVKENMEEKLVYKDGELLQKLLELTVREKLMTKADESTKVVQFLQPHDLQKELPLEFSGSGCKTLEEIEEILQKVVEYSVKTTHPYFRNQLFGGVDEVALTATWLLEALNTNLHTFEVAPVFATLEKFMINKLCKMFGWKEGDGIFSPGGNISNMYGIAMARHKKHPDFKERGLFGEKKLVMFTSDVSHYWIEKGAAWMGYGTDQVIKVKTDSNGKMRASALRREVKRVREEGREPFFVNATSGTTVFGAFDPLDELAEVCQEEALWLHVDACWGGGVVLSKKHSHLLQGIEKADSISWNIHKMLCAALQCSVFLVKYEGLLADSNKVGASYLFQPDKHYDQSFDVGSKSLQCGRKADVLKIWIMFKVHGVDLYERRIDQAFEAARHLESEISRREGFRLVLEKRECTNVCFWYIPPSFRNQAEDREWWMKIHKVAPIIKSRMVEAGTFMIGYQPVDNKNLVNFFRMIITCYPVATKDDMEKLLDDIHLHGKDL